MPGLVIHLAIAKRFLEKNKKYNKELFIKGTIEPDLLKEKLGKEKTHYGVDGKTTNPRKFLLDHKIDNGYNAGYLLHLIADKVFYNKYFTEWSPKMYDDYDILNGILIKKYELEIPKEVEKYAIPKNGELTYLKEEKVDQYIEEISNIKLEDYN